MAAAYPDAATEPNCEGPCGPSLASGASRDRRRPRTRRSRRSTHPRSRSQTGAGPLRQSSFGRSAIARYGPIQACAATASRQEQRLARTERRSRDGRTAEHGERGSARPLTSAVRQSMPAAVVLSRLVHLRRLGLTLQTAPFRAKRKRRTSDPELVDVCRSASEFDAWWVPWAPASATMRDDAELSIVRRSELLEGQPTVTVTRRTA
jgi:hypothetical protein